VGCGWGGVGWCGGGGVGALVLLEIGAGQEN